MAALLQLQTQVGVKSLPDISRRNRATLTGDSRARPEWIVT
jgi:hypothetical protein